MRVPPTQQMPHVDSQFLHKLAILLNLHVDNPMAIPLLVKFKITLLLVLIFTCMTTLVLLHYFIEQSRQMVFSVSRNA